MEAPVCAQWGYISYSTNHCSHRADVFVCERERERRSYPLFNVAPIIIIFMYSVDLFVLRDTNLKGL